MFLGKCVSSHPRLIKLILVVDEFWIAINLSFPDSLQLDVVMIYVM